jgi:hypothetical protein
MIWKRISEIEKTLEKGVEKLEEKLEPVVDTLDESSEEIYTSISKTELNDLQKPPLNKIVFWIVFVIASLSLGIPFYHEAKNSFWQETSGYLFKLDFEQIDIGSTNPRGPYDYKVFVKYSYRWKGKGYTGTNIYSDGNQIFDKRSNVEDLLQNKKPGESIKVFVDPNNPNRAAIVAGSISTMALAKMLGLMFVYFSIVLYCTQYLRVFD